MSLYQLEDQTPQPWAREGRFGDGGTWGWEIDASGLDARNRLFYRDSIPTLPDTSYRVVLRVQSTLVASNNGFEGLAVRLRGYRLSGSGSDITADQVWDSNPDQGGSHRWFSRQTNGYENVAFIIDDVPDDLDFVMVEAVVRASSGQVRFHNVECRHYFQRAYSWSLPGTKLVGSSGFSFEPAQLISHEDPTQNTPSGSEYLHYMTTQSCDIERGKLIEIDGRGLLDINAFHTPTGDRGDNTLFFGGFAVLFRVRSQQRWHLIKCSYGSGVGFISPNEMLNAREEALQSYDQYQVLITAASRADLTIGEPASVAAVVQSLEVRIRALDYARPTQ